MSRSDKSGSATHISCSSACCRHAAVDTADELAQLSQFVTNIIDFRDPDCTMTRFRNPDVIMALGSLNPAAVAPVLPYTPPKLYFANATIPVTVPPTVTMPLDQFGMEYNPIAINEVLAYSFERKGTVGGAPGPVQTNRFFVELVNTLTQANLPTGATIDASSIALDNSNYDLVIAADDPVSRPDPFTGQLLPVAAAGTPANYYGPIPLEKSSFTPAPPTAVFISALGPGFAPASPTVPAGSPTYPAATGAGTTSYFAVISNINPAPASERTPPTADYKLMGSLDPTDTTTPVPTTMPPTPPPGALTLNTTTPATIGTVEVGTKNAYPPKPWMAQVPLKGAAYYWVCLAPSGQPLLTAQSRSDRRFRAL